VSREELKKIKEMSESNQEKHNVEESEIKDNLDKKRDDNFVWRVVGYSIRDDMDFVEDWDCTCNSLAMAKTILEEKKNEIITDWGEMNWIINENEKGIVIEEDTKRKRALFIVDRQEFNKIYNKYYSIVLIFIWFRREFHLLVDLNQKRAHILS